MKESKKVRKIDKMEWDKNWNGITFQDREAFVLAKVRELGAESSPGCYLVKKEDMNAVDKEFVSFSLDAAAETNKAILKMMKPLEI